MMEQTGIEKAQKGLQGGKDEKQVVAGGIAIAVVVVLFVGWAIIFMHKIQTGAQQVNLNSAVPDQFNFTSVKDAQQQLQQSYSAVNQDLREVRAQSVGGSQTQQMQTMQVGGNSGLSDFTGP